VGGLVRSRLTHHKYRIHDIHQMQSMHRVQRIFGYRRFANS
jgi:hypothetical protein